MEMPVEERLKTLYQLQTTLSGIDEKRALRGELPLEVQDLEDEIEGLSTRIEKIQNEINEYEQAVTIKKGEIETAKASVERYKSQLDDVKNNREYDTLSRRLSSRSLRFSSARRRSARQTFVLRSVRATWYRLRRLSLIASKHLTKRRVNWMRLWMRLVPRKIN